MYREVSCSIKLNDQLTDWFLSIPVSVSMFPCFPVALHILLHSAFYTWFPYPITLSLTPYHNRCLGGNVGCCQTHPTSAQKSSGTVYWGQSPSPQAPSPILTSNLPPTISPSSFFICLTINHKTNIHKLYSNMVININT